MLKRTKELPCLVSRWGYRFHPSFRASCTLFNWSKKPADFTWFNSITWEVINRKKLAVAASAGQLNRVYSPYYTCVFIWHGTCRHSAMCLWERDSCAGEAHTCAHAAPMKLLREFGSIGEERFRLGASAILHLCKGRRSAQESAHDRGAEPVGRIIYRVPGFWGTSQASRRSPLTFAFSDREQVPMRRRYIIYVYQREQQQ